MNWGEVFYDIIKFLFSSIAVGIVFIYTKEYVESNPNNKIRAFILSLSVIMTISFIIWESSYNARELAIKVFFILLITVIAAFIFAERKEVSSRNGKEESENI